MLVDTCASLVREKLERARQQFKWFTVRATTVLMMPPCAGQRFLLINGRSKFSGLLCPPRARWICRSDAGEARSVFSGILSIFIIMFVLFVRQFGGTHGLWSVVSYKCARYTMLDNVMIKAQRHNERANVNEPQFDSVVPQPGFGFEIIFIIIFEIYGHSGSFYECVSMGRRNIYYSI